MTDSVLLPALLLLPIFDWTVTGALVAMAVIAKPGIPFLTERAVAALVIAIVTTAYAGIALNTEQGYAWFGPDVARAAVRVLIVVLGAAPILWLVNFWRGR